MFSNFSFTQAYVLTEKDNQLIDVFEERIFDIIDERDSVTPERVESLLKDILVRKLSERTRVLITVILEDLQYNYNLTQ